MAALTRAQLKAALRALRIFGGNVYTAARVVGFNVAAFREYAKRKHQRWMRKQSQ